MLLELVERALVALCFACHGAITVVLDEAGEVEFGRLVCSPGAVERVSGPSLRMQ